jgi:thiamine-monophosphate kinase
MPLDEHGLIARYFAPFAGQGAHGLLDDAATLAVTPGCELVVTSDAVVADVHFFTSDPPASIARKALAVNISDLAAKGAVPVGFVITLSLNETCDENWIEAFAGGLNEASQFFICPLLGGDTVRTPGPVNISITAFGEVPAGQMVMRQGANCGDYVYVTGTIGDAALGLALCKTPKPAWADHLTPAESRDLIDHYLHPSPKLALRDALRLHASSAMDISDGLAGDLAKLCKASQVTSTIQREKIPLSVAASKALFVAPELYDMIITGGDDYEILCTISGAKASAFEEQARLCKVQVTPIGVINEEGGLPVFVHEDQNMTYTRGSYSHF